MDFVNRAELLILLNEPRTKSIVEGTCDLVQLFLQGDFEAILNHEIGKQILKENPTGKENVEDIVRVNVETFILNSDKERCISQLEVLLVGAACLQLFVQNNWTGPLTDTPALDYTPPSLQRSCKDPMEVIHNDLSLDGAPIYNLSRHVTYLYLARVILLDCHDQLSDLQTADWWLMRYIVIHQELLEEKSPTLKSRALEVMDNVSKREPLITSDENRHIAVLFYLEAGHLCHQFYEYKRAAEYFHTAQKLSHLQIGLTGALGKRTKFQQDAKAQLMLKVTREDADASEGNVQEQEPAKEKEFIPKNVPLDDDTVLDNVKLSEDEVFSVVLSELEQAVVFGTMEDYKRSMAMERLTEEEVLTYIVGIIDQMSNWCIGTACLAQRSKLQWHSRRRVERSMSQYEELISQIGKPDPPVRHRLNLFYASKLPSVWILQKSFAKLLISLGMTAAGLEIYERLQLWEEAIECYLKIGKMEKAESVIREQLAVKETPNLYCFLGDVTRDLAHYHKAWELSKNRSARAMRCMGYLHFGKEEYASAMECFEKSLCINGLQIPVWFTLGCTAMVMEEYEKAANAFRRCVIIEADNYEAWANLASCLLKLKKLPAAFKVLKDAIKYNFENWRLWENFTIIGTDCGEFQEVIRGYHRLLDIKGKWTDVQVLRVLVKAVTENIPDADNRPSAGLRPKLQELFGRVTSVVTTESEIWRLYGQLTGSVESPDQTTSERALQYLQKAHRCVTQKSGWERDLYQSTTVAEESLQLASEYLKFADRCPAVQAIPSLSSGKLMLRSIITKLKQQHTDPVTQSVPEKLQLLLTDMEQALEKIVTKIDELKGS